ncbi:helix-turn-helix domain-containing protein, partial [Bacillus sp. DFI.2.34]|nr:helix-turn-helix domain-containing protein [Bacillus sp. DFI.2.34]
MIKSIKVMLKPNNKQKTKLFLYANTARFAYNWTIAKQQENFQNGGKFINDSILRKQ